MNTHAPRIARGEGLRGRSDGRAWRAGGGRGGTRRAGAAEPLGGTPRGGPGAGGLWSLGDEISTVIATRLGVRAEQVRRWRSAFRRGGAEALRSRPRPGRTPRKREAALAVARDVLAAPLADRPAWTLARLAAEVAARTGETISAGHLSAVLRKGATAGAGRGTRSRAGRTRGRSTTRACASGS